MVDPASQTALRKLSRTLAGMWRARAEELISIENEFGNRVRDLHRHYVVPDLQDVNPPDDRDDPGLIAPRQSAFGLFDEFLRREFGTENGNGCMFVLGDAGMGKTSLLVMLKYRHLTSSLPTSDDCVLDPARKPSGAEKTGGNFAGNA